MKAEVIKKLSPIQFCTLLIAMHVRNEMEDFHVDNLSDDQMKELNKIIRTAIFEALYTLENADKGNEYLNKQREFLGWSVPDYWEIPTEKEYLQKIKLMRKGG